MQVNEPSEGAALKQKLAATAARLAAEQNVAADARLAAETAEAQAKARVTPSRDEQAARAWRR